MIKLYATQFGINGFFVQDGKVKRIHCGVVHDSRLTIQEFERAIERGWLMEIYPRDEAEHLLVTESERKQKVRDWMMITCFISAAALGGFLLSIM